MSMSKITPVAMAEAPVAPAPDYDTVVKEEVNNSPKSRQSLKRAGTKYFGVGTLLMYKKVKDVHAFRQLLQDVIIWLAYVVAFFGFVLTFHSVKYAAQVTESLDLYFSTTDNPQKYAAAWVDIQSEPDLWHYIDNVLVEELLFGEEYALADHGGAKAGHRRGLAGTSGHNVPKEANHTACDPDHLDDAVTLHYMKGSNLVAGGVLMVQKRFVPAGEKFKNYKKLCHDHSHFETFEGAVIPCSVYGKHTDSTAEVHGFNDPKVYSTDGENLPGFKYHSKDDKSEEYHVDGYIIELHIDHGETAGELLQLLKRYEHHHWLDEYTEDVVIEVALYNNNLKLWVDVKLEAVFDPAGSIEAKHHVQTINLEPYNLYNTYNIQRVIFEIFFVAITVAMLVVEIQQCTSVKCNFKRYFGKYGVFESSGDIFQLLVSLSLICLWIYNLISPEERNLSKQLRANAVCHPPDLHNLIAWEETFLLICSFNVVLLLLRGLKFLLFLKSFAKIFRLLMAVIPDLLNFFVPLIVVIVFISIFGHIKYGKDLQEWKTFPDSLFTVYQWLFNMYDVTRIHDRAENLGEKIIELLFIILITMLTSVVLVNVMLAILVNAWDAINEKDVDEEGLQERHDLCFTVKTFKTCKNFSRMIFVYRDQHFLDVCHAMKHEHPGSEVTRDHFEGICRRAMDESKAVDMVSWFFNDSGQLITEDMIDDIRAAKQAGKPQYQYRFQQMAAGEGESESKTEGKTKKKKKRDRRR